MRNFTPHAVSLIVDWQTVTLKSEGNIRVQQKIEVLPESIVISDFSIPLAEATTDPADLDAAADAVVAASRSGDKDVIVSGMLLDSLHPVLHAAALKAAVAPDTSPDSAVRDDEGRIMGVRRFRCRSPK